MSVLKEKYFWDEAAALDFVEAMIWPEGPVCPHCGETDNIGKLNGASTRLGTYKCYDCQLPFTVKIGTFFEASRLPMHVWLQSIYFIAQSDFRVSAKQLEQAVGISGKTARCIAHRIHKALHTLDSTRASRSVDAPYHSRGSGKTALDGECVNSVSARPVLRNVFSSLGL